MKRNVSSELEHSMSNKLLGAVPIIKQVIFTKDQRYYNSIRTSLFSSSCLNTLSLIIFWLNFKDKYKKKVYFKNRSNKHFVKQDFMTVLTYILLLRPRNKDKMPSYHNSKQNKEIVTCTQERIFFPSE